jgi:helix-turn-helix protein
MRDVLSPNEREIRLDDIQQFEDEMSTYRFVQDNIEINAVTEGLLMLNKDNQPITRIKGKLFEQVVDGNKVIFKEIKEGV